MNAVEFTAQLCAAPVLQIPPEAAEKLPKSGTARVVIHVGEELDSTQRFVETYQEFMAIDEP
ncbi:MAG: hypothetical protein WCP06_06735 [Verrucomicrobiota bacterium]